MPWPAPPTQYSDDEDDDAPAFADDIFSDGYFQSQRYLADPVMDPYFLPIEETASQLPPLPTHWFPCPYGPPAPIVLEVDAALRVFSEPDPEGVTSGTGITFSTYAFEPWSTLPIRLEAFTDITVRHDIHPSYDRPLHRTLARAYLNVDYALFHGLLSACLHHRLAIQPVAFPSFARVYLHYALQCRHRLVRMYELHMRLPPPILDSRYYFPTRYLATGRPGPTLQI
jgi:hypothetical protein